MEWQIKNTFRPSEERPQTRFSFIWISHFSLSPFQLQQKIDELFFADERIEQNQKLVLHNKLKSERSSGGKPISLPQNRSTEIINSEKKLSVFNIYNTHNRAKRDAVNSQVVDKEEDNDDKDSEWRAKTIEQRQRRWAKVPEAMENRADIIFENSNKNLYKQLFYVLQQEQHQHRQRERERGKRDQLFGSLFVVVCME